jgi:hypothetical protein
MDIPVGSLVEENIPLKETNLVQKLFALMQQGFNGYVVLTTEGRSGIEEGIVLLKNGAAVGAVYEYLKFKKSFFGDSALQQLLNAALAKAGVIDIGSLSKQQVELIIAFNEKIELGAPLGQKEIAKIMPQGYNASIVEKALGKELKKKESKFDVFKKLGLGGVG